MQASSPSWKEGAFTKSKVQLLWRSMKLLVPYRLRRKLRSKIRSRQSPASSITALQTSINPLDTLRALQAHKWTIWDGQYLFLAFLGIFSLCVIQNPGPLIKTVVATLLLSSLVLPITRQFFLPALPIFAWLIFFYACQFIPGEYRPPIWVKVLPALENIFYGANLSNILSEHKHWVLDVLAWLPYGIIHFGGPFVAAGVMFIFAPPSFLPVFGKAFGYVNLFGVIIQVLFPCSPPWYENLYGLAPANYSIKGSPAGLAAIDKLFGVGFYTSTFTASPMVFGAFPSLHSGNATIEMLFMSCVFPKLTPFFVGYVFWLWWATMYLSHHYAVDLVAGSLLSGVVFFFAKANFMPRLQADKTFRWDYDFIEIGESPIEYSYEGIDGAQADSDEWTIGSSSSVSSGSLSPVDESHQPREGHSTFEKV